MAELREVLGWKWESVEAVNYAENQCQTYFNLPIDNAGQVTRECIKALPNYNPRGDIDFWYIGYSEPDQFEPVLGVPILFDITYLDEEE